MYRLASGGLSSSRKIFLQINAAGANFEFYLQVFWLEVADLTAKAV
jgi:hypothetical protein